MSKLVANYNGGASDEYGTFGALNRFLTGDVIEGFQVVQNGTPNMTVRVNPGSGRVSTGTYPSSYAYFISHDTVGGESVTIATAAASPRIDYILAYVDKGVTGATSPVNNTNNVLKFASVAGTPSGSPVVPTLSQIQSAIGASNPYILLAQVSVAALASTITNPNITDLRTYASMINEPSMGVFSYVESGMVWSTVSGLTASMTAGKAWINIGGTMVPVTVTAIASQSFTASRDTYVDLVPNGDGTGTITFNAQTNNAASPALATNAIRIAIIVTGASAVAAGGINQGQETAVLPIVSSTAYSVSDSLGNLICPRDPQRRVLGYALRTTDFNTVTTGAFVDVPGVQTTVNVPTGRKIRLSVTGRGYDNSSSGSNQLLTIREGSTTLAFQLILQSGQQLPFYPTLVLSPTPGVHTYKFSVQSSAGSTNVYAGTPGMQLLAELV